MRAATVLFSPFSRTVCRIKRRLHEAGRLEAVSCPVPSVSVGNIAFGGSGKTPLAMELLALFLDAGKRPALVSRGYRGRWEKTGGVASDGRNLFGTWRESGDEPHMAARAFPQAGVFVGRDRFASCRRAVAAGFDVIVLDDAFQHLRLRRDLDIVLYSPGAGQALREGPRALDRADMILTPPGPAPRLERLKRDHPGIPVFSCVPHARAFLRARDGMALPLDVLSGRRVFALCGIARPERFFRMIEDTGAEISGRTAFPDHHAYPERSRRAILKAVSSFNPDVLVTTEKDIFKLAEFLIVPDAPPLYVLRIGLDIDPAFRPLVLSLLERTCSAGEDRR